MLLNSLRRWRERGWTRIEADRYAGLWQRYGGSVMTHPLIVARLAALTGIPVRYLGWPGEDGGLLAGLPCWGRYLALSKEALKRAGKKRYFDLGNAEVILPVAPGAAVPVRQQIRYLSGLSQGQISTLRPQPDALAMARPLEAFSGRYRYKMRRDLRQLLDAGGEVQLVAAFSPEEQARLYTLLFEKRWPFGVPGKGHLPEVFAALREFMTGSVIFIGGQPAAIQILYQVASPGWLSVEYINGGFDPAFEAFAPGSLLTWLNIRDAWAAASAAGKPLRYSLGRADRDYKARWGDCTPVFQTS